MEKHRIEQNKIIFKIIFITPIITARSGEMDHLELQSEIICQQVSSNRKIYLQTCNGNGIGLVTYLTACVLPSLAFLRSRETHVITIRKTRESLLF